MSKIAFMSGSYEPIDRLHEYLTSACHIKAETDFYIGYKTIEVDKKDYLKALTYGSMFVMRNKELDICWVSPDDTRMHNINDLAVCAKNCMSEDRFLDAAVVKSLETFRYTCQPDREYDPNDYDLPNMSDAFINEDEELPNIDELY